MEKVLVTGVNGFVGHHLAKELYDNDIEVVGIGGTQGTTEKSLFVQDYHVIDLMDAEATNSIDFSNIDGIVHLAGLATVGPSFDNPGKYMSTNVGIEINLFEAALKQRASPKFVVISSGSLYDPRSSLPLTEASAILPNSPYAVSKLGQEQMAQYYTYRGFNVVVARPFNHIGPGQNIGAIVPDLTQQVVAFEKGQSSEVMVGNLDARRDYTDVRDIVRAYKLLLEKGVSGEIYNICTGRSLSGQEILDQILQASGAKPTIKQDPAKMRPSDTPNIYGSHDKLTDDTGWAPTIDIQTTIKDVVADWRSRN
ncbi:MAG: GDP-mannose 4,6-dehydratase [Candidatus Saccharimonadales bacterium]